MILKNCALVVADPTIWKILENVDIVIEGDEIVEVGRNVSGPGPELDCSGCVAIPAYVDAHTHTIVKTVATATGNVRERYGAEELEFEKRLRHDIAFVLAETALYLEAASGAALVADASLNYRQVAEAAKEICIHTFTGPVLAEVGENDALREVSDFCKAAANNPFVTPIANSLSLQYVEPERLVELKEAAKNLGIKLSIHASETLDEVYHVKKSYGNFPIELLNKEGVLDQDTILVNPGWATSWEINMLAEKGVKVVHCPTNAMMQATGSILPLHELLAKNIVTAVGTGTTDTTIRHETKLAKLLNTYTYQRKEVTTKHTIEMATYNAYKAYGIDAGKIEPGRKAYITVLQPKPPVKPTKQNLHHILLDTDKTIVKYTISRGKIAYDYNDTETPQKLQKKLQKAIEKLTQE